MTQPMKMAIILMAFSFSVALAVVMFPSRSKFPEVTKGHPSENIMEFGISYWRNLDYEEKRAFLDGYMTGLMSATMQVTLYHDIPHDDLKHIAMIGISSSYMSFQIDKAYAEEVNEERPLFQILFIENRKARSK